MRELTRSDLLVILGVSVVLLAGGGVLGVKASLWKAGHMNFPPRTFAKPPVAWPLNVNRASRKELIKLPGIGPVLARRIEDARPFSSVEDLTRVKGIGSKTLKRLRRYVAVHDDP